MNDIIETLKSLTERLENIRQDLEATVRDCEQMAGAIEQLWEGSANDQQNRQT